MVQINTEQIHLGIRIESHSDMEIQLRYIHF